MIRLAPALLLALCACAQPDDCALFSSRTGRIAIESDVAPRVADGGTVASYSPDCEGWCVRDATVTPLKPTEAAIGYCAATCALQSGVGCASGSHCAAVSESSSTGACVRD
jgi:hypothetical protein